MTLADLIACLDTLGNDLTIYAEAAPMWSSGSQAVAAREPAGNGLPAEASGMKYFLEVYLTKEVLAVWRAWRNGRTPSLDEQCEAIIHYATHDTYIPAEPSSET